MPKLIEVAPADANPEFEAAPKANGRHGKHKKKGGGGVVARVTARLKGAAGGSSRTSSYKAHQVAVKPKGGNRECLFSRVTVADEAVVRR